MSARVRRGWLGTRIRRTFRETIPTRAITAAAPTSFMGVQKTITEISADPMARRWASLPERGSDSRVQALMNRQLLAKSSQIATRQSSVLVCEIDSAGRNRVALAMMRNAVSSDFSKG